jgi:hypothetical protein
MVGIMVGKKEKQKKIPCILKNEIMKHPLQQAFPFFGNAT